jgi:hypothetical protein
MMLERILAMIDREMATVEHNILNGSCPDYTTYREQIAMLGTFMIVKEIVRKAFSEDDEDQ